MMSISRIGAVTATVIVITLIGCMTTEDQTSPGALPRSRTDVEPRLSASTYMAHGHLLERQGNFVRAAEQYQKALELNPNLVAARSRLGITLNKLGQHVEATRQFRRAIEQQPNDAMLYNNLGFSLYLEGELTEAETVLARALELRPTFRRARMNHAVVLAKLERFDEALTDFEMAGSPEDACFNLAVLYADAGRYADAAQLLEKALTVNPNFTAARQQLREIARLAAAEEAAAEAARVAAAESAQDTTADGFDQPLPVMFAGDDDETIPLTPEFVEGPPVAAEGVDVTTVAEEVVDHAGAAPRPRRALVQMARGVQVLPKPRQIEPSVEPANTEAMDPRRVLKEIDDLISLATHPRYLCIPPAEKVVAAIDAWVEAWILNAPWYEACRARLEVYLGPIDDWR